MFIVYIQVEYTIVLAKTKIQGMVSIFYIYGFNIKKNNFISKFIFIIIMINTNVMSIYFLFLNHLQNSKFVFCITNLVLLTLIFQQIDSVSNLMLRTLFIHFNVIIEKRRYKSFN